MRSETSYRRRCTNEPDERSFKEGFAVRMLLNRAAGWWILSHRHQTLMFRIKSLRLRVVNVCLRLRIAYLYARIVARMHPWLVLVTVVALFAAMGVL